MTLTQGWRDPDDRLHGKSDGRLINRAGAAAAASAAGREVVVDGVNRSLPEVLARKPILWQAVWTSLRAGGGRSVYWC